jgi:hypothetical protein
MNLTLPPLLDGDLCHYKDELPRVLPRFFMPRLQDKPQDPVMDALRIEQESRASKLEQPPPELTIVSEVEAQEQSHGSPEEHRALFWERAVKEGVRIQVS